MQTRIGRILKEFIHHLPYSAVGVAACVGILLGLEKMGLSYQPKQFFHVTHPTHIFLSAVVTTAIFWKYERRWLKTFLIGFFGTIPICTLSDVFFPYLGGLLFGTPPAFHLCAVEEPWLVYPSALLGIVVGMSLLKRVEKGTEIFHLLHIMVSALASLLYLISFDVDLWRLSVTFAFSVTVAAVWVPCCLSDIVFPLWFVKNGKAPCCGGGHHEVSASS